MTNQFIVTVIGGDRNWAREFLKSAVMEVIERSGGERLGNRLVADHVEVVVEDLGEK